MLVEAIVPPVNSIQAELKVTYISMNVDASSSETETGSDATLDAG